jgi:hypothetical protein
VSPLLAKVYLHDVLDGWFEREVQPRRKGRAFLIRYADDVVIGIAREEDARRAPAVLPQRFGTYGLALHPDKTRRVPFQRPPQPDSPAASAAGQRPGSVARQGFTPFWGRSRRGFGVVKWNTAPGRLRRALPMMAHGCRLNRPQPLAAHHRILGQKRRGPFAYFGITGTSSAWSRLRVAVLPIGKKWLARRRRRGFRSWAVIGRLLRHDPLPPALAVHSICRPVGQPVT